MQDIIRGTGLLRYMSLCEIWAIFAVWLVNYYHVNCELMRQEMYLRNVGYLVFIFELTQRFAWKDQ